METNKDFSKLRAFDFEAARAGAAICWHADGEVLKDVTITPAGRVCGKWDSSPIIGSEETWRPEKAAELFRMAPLAWVEGKPVYKGDVLWAKYAIRCYSPRHEVAAVRQGIICKDQIIDITGQWLPAGRLTWEEPRKPLCEVEGKPVFVGDRLWYRGTEPCCWATATGPHPIEGVNGISYKEDDGTEGNYAPDNAFTWEGPLCEVEGRPVFKGDVLWNKNHPHLRYDVSKVEGGIVYTEKNETGSICERQELLTWVHPKPQKVKRKGFIAIGKASVKNGTATAYTSNIFQTEESARNNFPDGSACVASVIEVEFEDPEQ